MLLYMDIGQGMLMGQNKENGATNRVTLSFKMLKTAGG